MSTLSIKAKEFVRDVKSAMDDDGLMMKYGLSPEQLQRCSSNSLTWTYFLKIRSRYGCNFRRARLHGRLSKYKRTRRRFDGDSFRLPPFSILVQFRWICGRDLIKLTKAHVAKKLADGCGQIDRRYEG